MLEEHIKPGLFKNRASYLFFLVVVTIFLLEIVLRITSDRNGRRITFLGGYSIAAPRTLADWEIDLKAYTDKQNTNNSYYRYDSRLGWTVGASSISWDSLYYSNSQGVRSIKDFLVPRDSSTLRIAVFGDSFTEGYKTTNDETWAHFLEKDLNSQGVKSEVLNYGVAGYGVDQAYLRWKTDGSLLNPDVVVLGLNMENFWRNLNTFRPNYFSKAGILLTKPRAIVLGDSLCWKNVPTIDPKLILDSVVTNFNESGLSKYEYFNDRELYSESIFHHSFLFLFINDLFSSDPDTEFSTCHEGQDLMRNLIATFAEEVNEKGSDFIVLQLLQPHALNMIKANEPLDYQKLLDHIVNAYTFCGTENLLKKYDTKLLYETEANHPNAYANELIGGHLAQYLIKHNKE